MVGDVISATEKEKNSANATTFTVVQRNQLRTKNCFANKNEKIKFGNFEHGSECGSPIMANKAREQAPAYQKQL